jgi:peptidoglycan/LPS O-acetylase OafA/YrhL
VTDATDGQDGPPNGAVTQSVVTTPDAATVTDEPPERSNDGARPLLRRYDSLDGLRAVAALMVLVTHVGDATALSARVLHFGSISLPLNNAAYEMNLGVEVFFVISAFLVYRPFLAANVDGDGHPEPLRFLWRRAWRIYPAYWFALIVIVAFTSRSLSFSNGANNGDLRVSHFLLVWGYDTRWLGANFGLRQAWTLVVEVSFYFFVPFWAWFMRRAGRWLGALRAEVIGALLLIPISPWMVWNLSGTNIPSPLRVLPPFITAFAIGMLFASLDVWHERRAESHALYDRLARRASWAWAIAIVAFIAFIKLDHLNGVSVLTASSRQLAVERTMHAVIAGLLAFPAIVGLQRTDGVRRILRWRPLVLLGIISYGFYLWHYLFIDTLRHKLDAWRATGAHARIVNLFADHIWFEVGAFFVIALVGATVMGALSWFLIERPAINFAAGRTKWWPAFRGWVRARFRRPSFYGGLVMISLAGLAWRVGYVIYERGRLLLAGDAFYYHTQANDIAHGRWFIDPSQYAFYGRITPSAGHPPTYLLYLAAVSKFIGTSELTHRLASTLLGAATVFFVGVLARMLWDDRAGWIAAGLAAVYAHLWINDEMLMSESMYQLWTVIAIITVYRFWRDPRRANAAWMGAAIAMMALSRAEATTLFPLLVIPLLIVLTKVKTRERVALGAIACVIGGLVMAPWVLYNMGRFVHPVVMSNGIGSTLMVANCDQTYHQPYLGYWSVGCASTFPVLQHGDESEKEVAWRKQGIDYIKNHLDRQPEMVVLRVARMWDVGFIGQNIYPFNGALEGRGIWQSLIATLQYLVLLPLAIHGLVLLHRRRITIIPFLAVAAVITITAASTFGITRYRAPVDALLPVLAAGAIVYRLDRSRRPFAHAGEPLLVPSAEPHALEAPAPAPA